MRSMHDFLKCPVQVNFAGLSGTTMEMVRNGWELSLMQHHHYDGYTFYGHHKGMNLRCVSAGFFTRDVSVSFNGFIANYRHPIMVEHVAREVIITSSAKPELVAARWDGAVSFSRELFENPYRGMSMGMSGDFQVHRHALDHYAKFTSVSDNSDIYIAKDEIWTIEKHLNEIRKIQEPKQKEIRKRILNESERARNKIEDTAKIYMVS